MQVTNINPGTAAAANLAAFKKQEIKKGEQAGEKSAISSSEPIPPFNSWQKDILLDAISRLENNKQVDNSHPLGKANNGPIETFDEAIIELAGVKSNEFAGSASKAQANIVPQQILDLFMD
jgi:hypothetical protein